MNKIILIIVLTMLSFQLEGQRGSYGVELKSLWSPPVKYMAEVAEYDDILSARVRWGAEISFFKTSKLKLGSLEVAHAIRGGLMGSDLFYTYDFDFVDSRVRNDFGNTFLSKRDYFYFGYKLHTSKKLFSIKDNHLAISLQPGFLYGIGRSYPVTYRTAVGSNSTDWVVLFKKDRELNKGKGAVFGDITIGLDYGFTFMRLNTEIGLFGIFSYHNPLQSTISVFGASTSFTAKSVMRHEAYGLSLRMKLIPDNN